MSTISERRGPHWRILASLILSVVVWACNDTDDVHVGLRSSEFQCSDGLNAVDTVLLNCGSQVNVDVLDIVVTIGGATKSTEIKGLQFDVVYPRDRFSYVPGSTSMTTNNFLTWGGGVCTNGACSAPAQMVGVCSSGACSAPAENAGDSCVVDADCNISCLATQPARCNVPGVVMPVLTANEAVPGTNARLSIAIDRGTAVAGVGVTLGGPSEVLRFQLKASSLTEPIDPTQLKFENARAVNLSNVKINSVLFKNQIILWVQ